MTVTAEVTQVSETVQQPERARLSRAEIEYLANTPDTLINSGQDVRLRRLAETALAYLDERDREAGEAAAWHGAYLNLEGDYQQFRGALQQIAKDEWDNDDGRAKHYYCIWCGGKKPRHSPSCPTTIAREALAGHEEAGNGV